MAKKLKDPKEKPVKTKDSEEYNFEDDVKILSTGSTRLNLAMSNRVEGGIPVGSYVNLIGASSSGKTFIAFSSLAEASIDKYFDNHKFVFDDAEEANLFKIRKLFGARLDDRLKAPSYNSAGEAINSDTIEDFRDNIITLINVGDPFIYVLDSFDSLSSRAEQIRTDEAVKKGAGLDAGTYGMEKAKLAGQVLRQIIKRIKKTNSILIILSQTRDNIGGKGYKDTRSGGNALKFYAVHESWSKCTGKIKKKVNGNDRTVGINTQLRLSKNKLTGCIWDDVKVPIFYSYGIDDISSNINFLLEEQYWYKKQKSSIIQITANKDKDKEAKLVTEFCLPCSEKKLITHIETNNLENELKKTVQKVWDDMLDQMAVKRKCRY